MSQNTKPQDNAPELTSIEEEIEIKVPIDPLNKLDLVIPVGINGKFWYITRGQKTKVPKDVAAVLEQAGYL